MKYSVRLKTFILSDISNTSNVYVLEIRAAEEAERLRKQKEEEGINYTLKL